MNIKSRDILVVTATLGNRHTLEQTVKSISKHGGDRIEHILVAPLKRCELLQKQYPNLGVLPEPEGCSGIFCALNYAFRTYADKYKYITFINDDDYWLEDYSLLISTLDKNPDIDVVYGKVKFIDERDNVIKDSTSTKRYKSFGKLLKYNITLLTQQATLQKSSLFFELGGFNEAHKLVADSEYWMLAIDKNKKFKYINKYCAAYMLQDNQLSSDTVTQQKELNELFIDKRYNVITCYLEIVLFRLLNLKNYLSRIIK